VSENYFHRMWCFTSHRRLKNVIIVLEWIPDTNALETTTPSMIDSPEALTPVRPSTLSCLVYVTAWSHVDVCFVTTK
jgi:hypothetical protein